MVTARQWIGLLGVSACSFSAAAAQTTISDAIVITELFESFQLVDPSGPSATPLGLSAANPFGVPGIPGQLLLEPSGTLLFTDFSLLRRLDPATGLITEVAELPGGVFSSIALEADGSVIANNASGVYRINVVTGQVDVFANDITFFGPGGVAVAGNGDIFVTEFFEDLYKINPVTGDFTLVPTDGAFSVPGLVEALPNGDLAIWDFPSGLFVFDPDTGTSTPVPTGLTASGTAVGSNGAYLVANGDGVFEIDLVTGVSTQLTPDETFFSAFDVVQGTITIPEPASAALLFVGLGLVRRRR